MAIDDDAELFTAPPAWHDMRTAKAAHDASHRDQYTDRDARAHSRTPAMWRAEACNAKNMALAVIDVTPSTIDKVDSSIVIALTGQEVRPA